MLSTKKMRQNEKVYIIAEVGPNHNGSMKTAKKIIKLLKNSGTNAVKFQLANPDQVYSDDAFMAAYQKRNTKLNSIKKMSEKNQLTRENHLKLKKLCKKYNMDYICSAFDLGSLKFLVKKLKIKIIKIPSGEITSIDMLNYISKLRKEIILSTGMSTFAEIKNAVKIINRNFKKKLTILHCVSNYPAQKEKLNLKLIDSLKKEFKTPVGYSDHSLGYEACLAAVAMGAKVIEKHVTLSTNQYGPDHKVSMKIQDFKELVKSIRAVELMLGKNKKKISNEEKKILNVARKSIVLNRDLKKGETIKKEYLVFKRPGTGITPVKIKKVLGKKLKFNIHKNRLLKI